LGANIQHGVAFLTQPSLSRTNDEHARHNERLEQELVETKKKLCHYTKRNEAHPKTTSLGIGKAGCRHFHWC